MGDKTTSAARWRATDRHKPGVEKVSGRWRLVVELEAYGHYSWIVQIDTGLCVTHGSVKRRLPGDAASPTQWVGVVTGHTSDGIEMAKQAAESAAAALRADMEGL